MADDYASLMRAVAEELLGPPNKALSSASEWRFGARGSLCVDIEGGVFFDHETNTGGGVLDMIARQTGQANGAAVAWLKERGLLVDEQATKRIVATYDYRDEAGRLLFQVVRFQPKDFRQRRPDGQGGWQWSAKGTRLVPYRWFEQPTDDRPVFIPEGEKDVDRLIALGLHATTNAGGAGKWPREFSQYLAGRIVYILPDNDVPGRAHAQQVAASLHGISAEVSVVALPGLPLKGDVSDWLDHGDTPERLLELCAAAEPWPRGDDGAAHPPLAMSDWLARDITPKDYLLGSWLHTTARVLISGDTGIGKTLLALDMAYHVAGGLAFLHWPAGRPARVLYVDGEMGAEEVKTRLVELQNRHGAINDNLHVLTIEDFAEAKPLDTEPGQRWLEKHVAGAGAELVILDNCMSLLNGSLKDDETWKATLPLALRLSNRRVGQLWINHTGHDASRSYGSKTLLWQMTAAFHLTKQDTTAGVAIRLECIKARGKRRDTEVQYAPILATFDGNGWNYKDPVAGNVKNPTAALFLEALRGALIDSGEPLPRSNKFPPKAGVRIDAWKGECRARGLLGDDPRSSSGRAMFSKYKLRLIEGGTVREYGGFVWLT